MPHSCLWKRNLFFCAVIFYLLFCLVFCVLRAPLWCFGLSGGFFSFSACLLSVIRLIFHFCCCSYRPSLCHGGWNPSCAIPLSCAGIDTLKSTAVWSSITTPSQEATNPLRCLFLFRCDLLVYRRYFCTSRFGSSTARSCSCVLASLVVHSVPHWFGSACALSLCFFRLILIFLCSTAILLHPSTKFFVLR